MRKNLPFVAISLALACFQVGLPTAAGQDQGKPKSYLGVSEGSRLIGKPVFLPDGEQLGWVESILTDAGRSRVTFLLLSLSEEEDGRVVPWSAFTTGEDGRLFLLETAISDAPYVISRLEAAAPDAEIPQETASSSQRQISPAVVSYAPFDSELAIEGTAVYVVDGVVVSSSEVPAGSRAPNEIVLVDLGRETVWVDLGEKARFASLGLELSVGDRIRAAGIKTVRGGVVVVEAVEIMVDSRVVKLSP